MAHACSIFQLCSLSTEPGGGSPLARNGCCSIRLDILSIGSHLARNHDEIACAIRRKIFRRGQRAARWAFTAAT